MIALGSAVQTKGLGLSLVSARKRLIATCRSTSERNTPRFSRRLVNLAKEALDGVEPGGRFRGVMEHKAGMTTEPSPHLGVLVAGVIVEDDVDDPAGRGLRLDRIEEANGLLMPMALHATADDLSVEHVEGGEQCGRAIALILVGHGPQAAGLQRQARL